jgi:hypothetical protein
MIGMASPGKMRRQVNNHHARLRDENPSGDAIDQDESAVPVDSLLHNL